MTGPVGPEATSTGGQDMTPLTWSQLCRPLSSRMLIHSGYTDKKEKKIFLIYTKIQSGAVGKSYMRKGFLIYEEMCKYFPIYEEGVSHI